MIHLYAEVLANIRQASLHATLGTHKNAQTKIDIASDRKTVSVFHEGETVSICLPTEVGSNAEAGITAQQGKEISVRLKVANIITLPAMDDTIGIEGPWSAKELTFSAQFRCCLCANMLLTNKVPLDFRDLPNQNWAEMMDLWHCHRPHDAEQDSGKGARTTADAKGYGSSSRVKATPEIAFVDEISFLLAEQSVENVKTSGDEVHCRNCGALLGVATASLGGWKIYKSSLSVKPSLESDWELYPLEIFVASQLLSLVESSAARKFVVHSPEARGGLLLWIFNPDVYYSTPKRSEPVVRALKALYQETVDAAKLLDKHQASLEELQLPIPIFQGFKATLTASTDLLPPSAQSFQDWKVGLISRYERKPSFGIKQFYAVSQNAVEPAKTQRSEI